MSEEVRVDGVVKIPKEAWYHLIDKLTRMDELLEIMVRQLDYLRKILEGKPVIAPTIAPISEIITFPISDRWSWSPKIFIRQVVPPMTPKYILYDEAGAGWIYYAILTASNKDLRWVVNWKSDETIEMNLSFKELYEVGASDSRGMRILKYDEVANIYTAEYAPGILAFPGTPFRERNIFYLINPTTNPVMFSLWAWLIKVE